jgi:hypothetical protein
MMPQPPSESADRLLEEPSPRRNLRFPSDFEAPPVRFTDSAGQPTIGLLENESYSGIAVLVPSVADVTVGATVEVDYFGHPVAGVIRRVEPREEGAGVVAIEWR